MKPLVSIIIPTYNRAHLIGETLDSVIAQTYQNWECIVVDDGSTDYTVELLQYYSKKYSGIRLYQKPRGWAKGANASRNFGFKISKGEYINWFDSDDIMHSEKIRLQIESMEVQHQIDFSICEYSLCDSKLDNPRRQVYGLENLLLNYLKQKAFFNLPTTLFKRRALEKIKLDESLYKSQEVDFFLRLLQDSKLNFSKINKSLVLVRLHDDNITSSFMKGSKNAIESEMRIKLHSLNYIKKHGSKRDLEEFLNVYYSFLIKILDQNIIGLYFKYVLQLFLSLPTIYFIRLTKLIWLGGIFFVFKRRPYRYRNILKFYS